MAGDLPRPVGFYAHCRGRRRWKAGPKIARLREWAQHFFQQCCRLSVLCFPSVFGVRVAEGGRASVDSILKEFWAEGQISGLSVFQLQGELSQHGSQQRNFSGRREAQLFLRWRADQHRDVIGIDEVTAPCRAARTFSARPSQSSCHGAKGDDPRQS